MVFKFRFETLGGHTHIRLFGGRSSGALGGCGTLVMRNEEWTAFRQLLDRIPPLPGSRIEFVEEA